MSFFPLKERKYSKPPPLLSLSLQLQKRKEREEQLEDVIQAYEKIHMEKSNLQRDLDKMVSNITQSAAFNISQEPYASVMHSVSSTLC